MVKKKLNADVGTTKEGITTVVAKVEKRGVELKDVELDTLDSMRRALKEEVKETIDALVGRSKETAKATLDLLVKEEKISSFKFVNPGQSFVATNFISDRVQVSIGADQEVKSVEVG